MDDKEEPEPGREEDGEKGRTGKEADKTIHGSGIEEMY